MSAITVQAPVQRSSRWGSALRLHGATSAGAAATRKGAELAAVPALRGCVARELAAAAALLDETVVPGGHLVARGGGLAQQALLVRRGALALGHRVVGADAVVGVRALADRGTYLCDVYAARDTSVYVLSTAAWQRLLAAAPSVAAALLRDDALAVP